MISITVISHLRWLSPLWWLAPPPFPRKRGHNKAPQSNPFISRTTISTGYSSPACGGSPAKRARGKAFPTPAGRLYGFFIRGRLLSFRGALPQPSAAKPLSNLRTLGAIATSNFRTLKPQRGLSKWRPPPAYLYTYILFTFFMQNIRIYDKISLCCFDVFK